MSSDASAPATTPSTDLTAPDTQPAEDSTMYSFAQKHEIRNDMKVQIDKIKADIAELSAGIDKADDKAKADAKPMLRSLLERAAKLDVLLGKAQDSTLATWNEVKAEFKTGLVDVEKGIADVRTWLSGKIAP
jgi:hypothetical protein